MNKTKLAICTNGNDEWLTPPSIIESLGPFDTDPCSPINRPWATAKTHYTIKDNGLHSEWKGRVWMNPPYGRDTHLWLEKLSNYRNGIALIFARTETSMFFNYVWERATSILFIRGRIRFYNVDGSISKHSGGAPSCLIAYGEKNSERLKTCGIDGFFIEIIDGKLTIEKDIQQLKLF